MKKILFTITIILFTMLNVKAIEVTTEQELNSCIATQNNTCVLVNDIALTHQITIQKKA